MAKKTTWTIGGVPMTAKQIAAIERAKQAGKPRVIIPTNKRQSKAVRAIADQADAELAEIASSIANRPKFAITMHARRKQLGFTLDQLAEITGISKANLSKIERGRTTNPTLETLKRIGEGLELELSVDYLAVG